MVRIIAVVVAISAFSAAAQTADNGSDKTSSKASDYGFVIDNSASFRLLLESSIRLINGVTEKGNSEDRVFFIRFSTPEKIILEEEFTSDMSAINDAANAMYVEGGKKAVLDAVSVAAKYISENSEKGSRSRGMVLITDGDDRDSSVKIDPVVQMLKDENIRVIAVGISDGFKIDTKLLEHLTKASGGRLFLPKNQTEFKSLAQELADELHKP